MRYLPLFCLVMLTWSGCEFDAGSGSTNGSAGFVDSTTTDEYTTANDLPEQHACAIDGEILEGNEFWGREQARLFVIKADSTTLDESFGPSHRVLEVYDTDNCERLHRSVLPVNRSPDYPYYLAEKLYNNTSRLVAISGFNAVYVYDAAANRLLDPLQPAYRTPREAADAQSGMILRLEVWEDYLIGYSQDMGPFVFDLTDKANPEATLPFAEYQQQSLFLLPSKDGGSQVLSPYYDFDADAFVINPLLQRPRNLNTNVTNSARNNRFLVLRDEEGTALAIDLQARERVTLPTDLAQAKTQDVLAWMRQNR